MKTRRTKGKEPIMNPEFSSVLQNIIPKDQIKRKNQEQFTIPDRILHSRSQTPLPRIRRNEAEYRMESPNNLDVEMREEPRQPLKNKAKVVKEYAKIQNNRIGQQQSTYSDNPKIRRPKSVWTLEECQTLEAGMAQYGNNWAAIKKDSTFGPILESRTNVDLKDKARNIRKAIERLHKDEDEEIDLGVFGNVTGRGGNRALGSGKPAPQYGRAWRKKEEPDVSEEEYLGRETYLPSRPGSSKYRNAYRREFTDFY
jgi:hypothetical protein